MSYHLIKSYNLFTDLVIQGLKDNGLSDAHLREELYIDQRTWKKRKQNPKDFTISQVEILARKLKLEPERIFLTILKCDQSNISLP